MRTKKSVLLFLLLSFAVASIPLWAKAVQEQEMEPVKAKNVILLVGDGMGLGALELARIMEYGKDGNLYIQQMENIGLMTTWSSDEYVTDSAAAGTALACGVKTYNKGVGIDADGNPVESISEYLQALGKAIGLISTNTVDDATPATFGAHTDSRSNKAEIVQDYFAAQWDVILGGGDKYFGEGKQDGVDMIEEFKNSGYTYVATQDELNAVSGVEKLLGLFSPSYMSYKTDREELDSTEPSLQEMTAIALDILSADPDGFFLMSEGARIDHSAHALDATTVWLEMIEFDETVKYCLDWAAEHGDTLVIVTADHNTMTISPSEGINIDGLKNVSVSSEYMALQMEKNADETAYTVDSIISVIQEYSGITPSQEEALGLQSRLLVELYSYKLGYQIGSFLAEKLGVGGMVDSLREFGGTGGHTAAWVPVFAEGPGADAFCGTYDNTDLITLIKENVQ